MCVCVCLCVFPGAPSCRVIFQHLNERGGEERKGEEIQVFTIQECIIKIKHYLPFKNNMIIVIINIFGTADDFYMQSKYYKKHRF